MTMTLVFESKGWVLESNGQMHFKQDQLFHLHRLSLVIIGLTGQRLRFRTRDELEYLLAFAGSCELLSVQTQLAAVRSVMPFHWADKKVLGADLAVTAPYQP